MADSERRWDSETRWSGSPDPIKIGWLGSALDGPDGGYDRIHRLAFDVALEQGLLDRPVEFVLHAENGLPRGSARNAADGFRYLVDQGCIGVAGAYSSDNAIIVAPLANELKVPLISWAGTERLSGDYCFRLGNGDCGGDAALCVAWLSRHGYTRVAVLSEVSPNGEEYFRFFRQECRRHGLNIVSLETVSQNPANLTENLDALRQSNPDALCYMGYGMLAAQGLLRKALDELAWDPPRIMGTSFMFYLMGLDKFEGWVGIDQFDPSNPLVDGFHRRFVERHGENPPMWPNAIPVLAYDTARVMAEGLFRAPTLSGPGLKDGLERIRFMPSVTGGPRTHIAGLPTSTECSEGTGCSTAGCGTENWSSRVSSSPRSEHRSTETERGTMHADDLIMVSVDDHLVEPPNLFEGRLPARYQDEAPSVQRLGDGSDVWVFNGQTIPNIGLNAVAGRPREEYGIEPTAFEEMRPGCFDVHERIKDMNAGGVLGSMNFPSFPGFSARLFAACRDKDLALAVLRSYNDWHIDEWCGSYPGRFIPMALPILWDPELCAEEVRRVAAKGCHSLTFTENPVALGYPSFHDPSWDPLWTSLCDEHVVLSIHLGSSGQLAVTAPDAPVDVMITLQPMNICSAASDLLWSRVIKTFPIRVALSEGGTGWIPYFLDRVDRTYEMHHKWTGQDFGGKLPSDVFREHFLTCFISDPIGVQLRHQIGIDNIAWECDYPHSDSSWPDAPEELAQVAAGVPDDELEKISWANACRWYSFDPLAHRPRERSTVRALRAEAEGHDVSIRSYDQGRFERTGQGVDLATIAAQATA